MLHQPFCDIVPESTSNNSLVVVDRDSTFVGHTHNETASVLTHNNQTVDFGFESMYANTKIHMSI